MSPIDLALKAQRSRSEYIRNYAQLILGTASAEVICKIIQDYEKRYVGLMPSQVTQLKALEAVLDYNSIRGRHEPTTTKN